MLETKRPEFVVSDRFEFKRFSKRPDFALAQSLFTHLSKRDIELCFGNLSSFVRPGCRFFATFLEVPVAIPQIRGSHANRPFHYTRRKMERFGAEAAWEPRYIGSWNHPRGQMMIEYVKC